MGQVHKANFDTLKMVDVDKKELSKIVNNTIR